MKLMMMDFCQDQKWVKGSHIAEHYTSDLQMMGAHKICIWIIAVQLGYSSTKGIFLIHQLFTAHVNLKSRNMSLVNSD